LQVLAHFHVDPAVGLREADAAQARRRWGPNELPPDPGTPFWKLVLKQFDDLLVKILIAAAAVSLLIGLADGEGWSSLVEPGVIVLILVANATVGVLTETNAEKAIEELKAYQADVAAVFREGRLRNVPAAELVPGDIVELAVGNKVPADVRLIAVRGEALSVDQSILTGESGSVEKFAGAVSVGVAAVIQDKTCVAFGGTVVTGGKARGVVFGTGVHTAMGKIRDAMHDAAEDEELTPLKKKLDEFGTFLSKAIAAVCVLVWVVNIGHFADPVHGGFFRGAIYYFKIAVALAVAAIPEGLPAVVTTCLALGTRKMAKRNAVVRSLPSVETLGCTSVICSDKTGTLTTNAMTATRFCVVKAVDPPGNGPAADCLSEFRVDGEGYAPNGDVRAGVSSSVVARPAENAATLHLAICASLCNDATLAYDEKTRRFEKIGESTEAALRALAEKIGLPGADADPKSLAALRPAERATYCASYWDAQFRRVASLEFSRDRKMMSVLATRKGQAFLFTKGAPEQVLDKCVSALTADGGAAEPMTNKARDALRTRLASFARGSLRVLALAMKPVPKKKTGVDSSDERDMTFLGFVGVMDPPRPEAARAVSLCRAAGIRVIMVTGDNKATAEAVARAVGLGEDVAPRGSHPSTRYGELNDARDAPADATDLALLARKMTADAADAGLPMTGVLFPPGVSFRGAEFDAMDDAARQDAVRSMAVFSRVEPQHKSTLVQLLKKQQHVVAMTGDGVNDAPALKRADIGVAMGSGTAVAKHASDMVLADDNFASIVAAVAEGRAIYDNTKQFIRYMVSSNIGEVVCIFVAAALGMPETLSPIQLLWVNLVTDGLPATALGFNKPDADIMRRRPRRPDDSIVDAWLFVRYMVVGLYVGFATVGAFAWWFTSYESGPNLTWAQLTSFQKCEYSCEVFNRKVNRNPSTMSLSVLCVVEMFNALNALSENGSLFVHHPWSNNWLTGAIVVSMALHCLILYVPWLADTFAVAPLSLAEWRAVIGFSAPVIFVDEVLKLITRKHGDRLRAALRRGVSLGRRADLLPRARSSAKQGL
jgi:magnesium-transporting ATPase (P-type)